MKDLLEFAERHFAQLSRVDWGVVLVLAFIIGSGLFFLFRWLFESRLAAQRNILDLRAEETQDLRAKIARKSEASDALLEQLRSLEEQRQSAAASLEAALRERATIDEVITDLVDYIAHLRGWLLIAQARFIEYEKLRASLRVFEIYSQPIVQQALRGGPPPAVMLAQLVQTADEIGGLSRLLAPLTAGPYNHIDITPRVDILREVAAIQHRPASEELDRLQDQVTQLFEALEASLHKQ